MFESDVAFLKFLHVIAAVTLAGIHLASFFYTMHSHRQKQGKLIRHALKVSFLNDAILVMLIATIYWTAIHLQQSLRLSPNIPWIIVAHIIFGMTILLWLAQLAIRVMSFNDKKILFPRCYTALSVCIWIMFALIIRDACLHSTWVTMLSSQ